MSFYARFAAWVSRLTGSSAVFLASLLFVGVWLALGPSLHFSAQWSFLVNDSTTVGTFLLALLIQNTLNRENAAVRVQLAEIIVSFKATRNRVLDASTMSEEEIDKLWEAIQERRNGGGAHEPGDAVPPEE